LNVLLLAWSGFAQKSIKKSVLDDKISSIRIDGENCYLITLATHNKNEIIVEAQIDGEYSNDLDLIVSEDGNTVLVSAGFQANFKHPNDKLSAHKVISISLNIIVPIWKDVLLYGTNSRVIAKGKFRNLNISLADGDCKLVDVSDIVTINTQSGDISAASKRATIKAHSKYGEVSPNPIPNGGAQYMLNTVTGNIVLHKTE
jgi:hypothetical protein